MRKNGPWLITDSETIYKNEWMEVVEDRVVRPDGKKGIFTVVHQKPGISVIPYEKDGTIILIKEFHYAVEKETIEAISGGVEEGETPEMSALRELQEEAGIVATECQPLGVVHPFTSAIYSPAHLFMASSLCTTKRQLEGTEAIEVLRVPFSQAMDWIAEGKIVHAPTIVLLYKMRDVLQLS